MSSTLHSGVLAGLMVLAAGIAGAESLNFKQARKVLPKGTSIVAQMPDTPFLDDKERAIVLSLKDTIPYYGAVALSPDEGLYVEWLNASGQHHSPQAARVAALAHCNANRKAASAKCVVVLEVSPKGAKPEAALSLSADAVDAVKGGYKKLKGPKAFAISPSLGTFGFADGDGARALKACADAGAGAQDCVVVIED
ncbi:5-aminolevulic acid synthase [uncultured Litoreibacter sp.]|uniref:5-aminolevulic acid synthase n=1 Tax=uncultured Litoreibacter sp. TaxID=1392394 RepID=UPI00260F41A1|nr:5-aminolevulic acid synthase [uncultured Litoreibacter sp.]